MDTPWSKDTPEKKAKRAEKHAQNRAKLTGKADRSRELGDLGRAAMGMGVTAAQARKAREEIAKMGKVGKQVMEDVAVAAGAKPKRGWF